MDFRQIGKFRVQPHDLAPGERGHRLGCHCATCDALRLKVMTTDRWFALHGPHTSPVTPIREEPYPHPSGTWVRLVCPCGARQVTVKQPGTEILL